MERNIPEVLPVKPPDNLPKEKPLHPNLPKPPTLLTMISPVKTGKSTIVSNLFLNENFYGQDYFDEVHIISNTIYNDVTSRFLLKSCECYDHYEDSIIEGIVERQKKYEKQDQPHLAVALDDCLGSIRREATINHLASRFRHYNIKLLLISSQNFRNVSPVIRSNSTAVIVGSPFPNSKELGKIAEEYGDMFGGEKKFLQLYRYATPKRYDFLYLDLSENPPHAYHKFSKKIAEGDKFFFDENGVDINDLEENSENPKTTTEKINFD